MVVTWGESFGAAIKIFLASIVWIVVGGVIIAFAILTGNSVLLIGGLIIGILLIQIGIIASFLKFGVGLIVREVVEGFREAAQTPPSPAAPPPGPPRPPAAPPPSGAKFCAYCGRQIPMASVYCPICGAKQS